MGLKLNATNGGGSVELDVPNTVSSDVVLTLPDADGDADQFLQTNGSGALSWATVISPDVALTTATSVSPTSSTAIDFTGIPSGVKRITVMFHELGTNGISRVLIQLGDSGGIETSGYTCTVVGSDGTALGTGNNTQGASVTTQGTGDTKSGQMIFSTVGSNNWVYSGLFKLSTTQLSYIAGGKTLSDTLTQLRITTVNGTDAFDAGTINILYEG